MVDDRRSPEGEGQSPHFGRRNFLRWGGIVGAGALAGCPGQEELPGREGDPGRTSEGVQVPDPRWFDYFVDSIDGLTGILEEISPGESVFLRPGRYETSEGIVIDTDDVTITGGHYQSTNLVNESTPIIRVVDAHRVRLSGLNLTGNHTNSSDLLSFETSDGITYRHFVHDLRIGESRGNGLYLEQVHDSTFQQLEIFAVGNDSDKKPTWNLKVDAGEPYARANSFIDCRFERSAYDETGGLISLDGLHQSQFISSKFHAPQQRPSVPLLDVRDCRRSSFAACNFYAGWPDEPARSVVRDPGGYPTRYVNCVFWGEGDTVLEVGNNKIIAGNGFYHFNDAAVQHASSSSDRNIIVNNYIEGGGGSTAIRLGSESNKNVVTNNNFVVESPPAMTSISDNTVANNVGLVTRRDGQVTLPSDSRSVTVDVDISLELDDDVDLQITPTHNWLRSEASKFAVESVDSTAGKFTIRVDSSPGQDVAFNWSIDLGH